MSAGIGWAGARAHELHRYCQSGADDAPEVAKSGRQAGRGYGERQRGHRLVEVTHPRSDPGEASRSKYARASAISPFLESRNMVLPDPSALSNVTDLLEEAKNSPNSSYHDTIDAMSQTVNWVLFHRVGKHEDGLAQPEEYDLIEEQSHYLNRGNPLTLDGRVRGAGGEAGPYRGLFNRWVSGG